MKRKNEGAARADSVDVVTRVKEAADIVQVIGEYVDLKKSGSRWLGLCPFHGEKTPSFSVTPAQQFFHCFGCGESGDVISFVMKYQNVDFPGALRILGDKFGVSIPEKRQTKKEMELQEQRRRLYRVSEKAAECYEKYLYSGRVARTAHAYLNKRGVTMAVAKKFKLGFAPPPDAEGWNFLGKTLTREEQAAAVEAGLMVEKSKGGLYDRFRDRIVFPIFNISGQICGFGGRILGKGQPKYLNSPESPVYSKSRLLLGLYQTKDAIRRSDRAVLVEGNFDMISLFAAGCENVVAPLGTALTREQLRLLKKFTSNVVMLFDGDAAGRKAAVRATPLFLQEGVSGRVAILPDGHDPDSFVREFGVQDLRALLEEAQELPEFTVGRLREEYGLSYDGKLKIIQELKPLLAAAGDRLKRDLFISHFEKLLDMEKGTLAVLEEEVEQAEAEEQAKEELQGITEMQEPEEMEASFPHEWAEEESSSAVVVPAFGQQKFSGAPHCGMTFPQRQIAAWMVCNLDHYRSLVDAGVRKFLTDTPGESLFLTIGQLLEKNEFAGPEELLNVLVEGEERTFVSWTMLYPPQPADRSLDDTGDPRELEFQQILDTLGVRESGEILGTLQEQIILAEKMGDMEEVDRLMMKQVQVAAALHRGKARGG
ncbi:DNA primase [Desulforhopalus vacuolatus]|nr:DNA primase [Desulforhopalus vacuolatus]